MKKILLVVAILLSFYGFGQDLSIRVEVLKIIQVSEAVRDTYVVPAGQTWLCDNLTAGEIQINRGGSGWTSLTGSDFDGDHGSLTGLTDDDHTQYLNTTRALTWLQAITSLSGHGWFLDEDDMVSNSAIKTVSQQSLVAYVASQISAITDDQTLSLGGTGNKDLTIEDGNTVDLSTVALIGSAVQPGDNVSGLTNDAGYITAADAGILPTNPIDVDDSPFVAGVDFANRRTYYITAGTYLIEIPTDATYDHPDGTRMIFVTDSEASFNISPESGVTGFTAFTLISGTVELLKKGTNDWIISSNGRAVDIVYNNAPSGRDSENVQDALDEAFAEIDLIEQGAFDRSVKNITADYTLLDTDADLKTIVYSGTDTITVTVPKFSSTPIDPGKIFTFYVKNYPGAIAFAPQDATVVMDTVRTAWSSSAGKYKKPYLAIEYVAQDTVAFAGQYEFYDITVPPPPAIYQGANAADPENEVVGTANTNGNSQMTVSAESTTPSPQNGAAYLQFQCLGAGVQEAFITLVGVNNGDDVTVTLYANEIVGLSWAIRLFATQGWVADYNPGFSTGGATWVSVTLTGVADQDDPVISIRTTSGGAVGHQLGIDNIIVTLNWMWWILLIMKIKIRTRHEKAA